MRSMRMILGVGAGIAALSALVWALMPTPLAVDLVAVRRGPMEVTVSAEGVTQVRDTWLVTAPISGMVGRSQVRVGDLVDENQTELARIRPAVPALLDARARAQAEAAVTEVQATVQQSEVQVKQAEIDLGFAQSRLDRDRELAARGVVPRRILEDSEQAANSAVAALEAARFDLEMHRAALVRVQAQLVTPEALAADAAGECCVPLKPPHSGTVLWVADMSARPVEAGAPLYTIGDLTDLQVQVDLLSSDAVRVFPGAAAYVEGWGGDEVLAARVEHIDPVGFTRVSALGIEEQRVRVRLDLEDGAAVTPSRLGNGFRVFVKVVIWSGDDVLQVPQSGLFRQGAEWAVYRAIEGKAVATLVRVGHTQDLVSEVHSGLAEGDLVITYPGNRISDGANIAERQMP